MKRRSARNLVPLAAALALSLPGRVLGQGIPVTLSGPASSAVGVPFFIPLQVDMSGRTERLGSFALRVSWNPAVVQFLDGANGNFGDLVSNEDSIPFGVIRLSGANPAGVGGKVILGVARFNPQVADTTTFVLTVQELYAAGTFIDLRPDAVVTSRGYCPAKGRFGDIESDGQITSRDGLLALMAAVGLPTPGFDGSVGDVDGDGQTTPRDALIILSNVVGLDTSPFRLLRVAPGACGTDKLLLLSIRPGDQELITGQQIGLTAYGSDAASDSHSLTGLTWSTSNPAVAAVAAGGGVAAVAPGSAVVTAKEPGGRQGSVTITVVGSRHTHWVDALAISEEDRTGSATLPFATIAEGLAFAAPNDTVRVRAGRYVEQPRITKPVVLQGETSGPNRAVIASGSRTGKDTAVTVGPGPKYEVRNLVLDAFGIGLAAIGTDTAVIDSLDVNGFPGSCTTPTGAVLARSVRVLQVRHSTLVGAGQSACDNGIQVVDSARLVVIEDSRINYFASNGVILATVDSAVVRRSVLQDDGDGFRAFSSSLTHPTVALLLEDNQFRRNYAAPVQASSVRSLVTARNVFDQGVYSYPAFQVNGIGLRGGYVRMSADSVRTSAGGYTYGGWVSADGFDSVVVSGMRVTGASDGRFSNVGLVRVTNSSFKEVVSTPINVTNGGLGSLVVDSVDVGGSAYCGQCGNAIETFDVPSVSINRLRGAYLYYGVYAQGDSALALTNSAFSYGYQVLFADGAYDPSPLVMQNVTGSYLSYGVEANEMTSLLDGVVLSANAGDAGTGIYLFGGRGDTVRNSTVADFDDGMELYGPRVVATGNTVVRPRSDAFYVQGNTVADSLILLNNTVSCDASGAETAGGFYGYAGNHRYEGNSVMGCGWGMYIDGGIAGAGARVRSNTIALSTQSEDPGLRIGGLYRAEVVGNTITDGTQYTLGSIHLAGQLNSRMPYARVDSNTIRNAHNWGIRSQYVDSLLVRGNLIEDVTQACCSNTLAGAISGDASRYVFQIKKNTLRRIHGYGVTISQVNDSATAVVDTNAISGADSAAVRVLAATLVMRQNNIRSNARYGLWIQGSASGVTLSGNAFKGNGLFAVSTGDYTVNAQGNWWGVDGALPHSPGADSVSGPVNVSSPLASEPTDVPPLAPPVLVAAPVVRTPVSFPPAPAQRPAAVAVRSEPAGSRSSIVHQTAENLRAARRDRRRAEREAAR